MTLTPAPDSTAWVADTRALAAACIDFHTHHPSREGERVVLDGRDTWGVHPWQAGSAMVMPSDSSGLLAIGECGLDKLAPVPLAVQEQVFVRQLRLAQEWQLSVIVHCVRCIDQLMALRRAMRPTVPWIVHGFRGKPQQLQSLLAAGFYVSFGFRFCEQSLVQCPIGRLLLETDADPRPVSLLYAQVARLRGTTVSSLTEAMQGHYEALFARPCADVHVADKDSTDDHRDRNAGAREEKYPGKSKLLTEKE